MTISISINRIFKNDVDEKVHLDILGKNQEFDSKDAESMTMHVPPDTSKPEGLHEEFHTKFLQGKKKWQFDGLVTTETQGDSYSVLGKPRDSHHEHLSFNELWWSQSLKQGNHDV